MPEDISTKPYRVLALDGGGMRGLYTASLLKNLANRFKDSEDDLDIGKGFDLIIGTSTGSLLAAGLAAGISITKIIEIYKEMGMKIFRKRIPHYSLLKFFWALRHLHKPLNGNDNLKNTLNHVFKNETLGQLYDRRKIGLCIPAVNMTTHKLNIFKTPHIASKKADNERKLSEVCLASSAAPVFFPVAEIDDVHGSNSSSYFVDGGLCANNPVMIGLIEALYLSNVSQSVDIVSIGTCPLSSGEAMISGEEKKGLFYWNFGIKALEISMFSQSQYSQSMAELLAENFTRTGKKIEIIRLNQTAPSSIQEKHLGLDNASEKSCNTLIQLGNSDALEIKRLAENGNDKLEKLIPLFSSMSTLQKQEK
ncbi:CBASS cGAMP-activated phospholipase [Legionella septentrionalis]|uniref:CBASS cGAMP-activated phospholipase n=1 Tax=Legionella septentrionalis TaxID=2498109 RepID=UPI000F8D8A6B|nr:CBASS cGAMP-activated phospholipase [Legionella septentrionalis]RUR14031.1 hypothetical protein ELY10_09445 [Legionella septentrionalis]